jgi:hypothetical protein
MYESIITVLLLLICAVSIAYVSYSFGRTIRSHEDKLDALSDDIARHEKDITRIDETLVNHINSDKNTEKKTLTKIKKIFTS